MAVTPERRAGGHPVLGALSPSRANDFMRCPLLYRFRAIDRFPERPSEAAVRGTLIHAVLESLFDLPAADRTREAALEMLPEAWAELLAEQPHLAAAIDPEVPFPMPDGELFAADPDRLAAWLAGAQSLVGNYFQMEDPTVLEPAEREMRIEVQLNDDLLLRGFIDRVDVSDSGLVRILDYKSGRSPSPRFQESALFQMMFYALMVWRSRGVVPHTLQLNYLADTEVLRYSPTEGDLLKFEAKVEQIWSEILDAYINGEWKPRESRLCDWCDHQARCPARGGELPELPAFALPPLDGELLADG